MDLQALLTDLPEKRCKVCRHAWLPDTQDTGWCKQPANASGTRPKPIDEMHTCPLWEASK